MADFGGGDPEAFRKEVREWVDANFPAELKGRPNPMMREERSQPSEAQEAWRKAVGAKGWGTPTWPSQYGGGGLGTLLVDEVVEGTQHEVQQDDVVADRRG